MIRLAFHKVFVWEVPAMINDENSIAWLTTLTSKYLHL